MFRFRWRLFWILVLLNALALLGVFYLADGRPLAFPALSFERNHGGLDPVVEVRTPRAEAEAPDPSPVGELSGPSRSTAARIELWHSWSARDGDALAAMLSRFNRKYPRIEVVTAFVEYGELAQTYSDAVTAGGGPDLLLGPNWWLPDLVKAGVALPLEDLIGRAERAQFAPAAVANLSSQGVLYGIPTSFELVALYFNRRLLTEEDLPRSLEEMIQLARKVPSQGIGIYTSFYHLFWGIPAHGGELFDADGRVIMHESPGAADFLAWLARAGGTPGIFAALDYGMLLDRFKKEEYALFVDGPWSLHELEERFGADLGVAPLPAGPAGPARPWLSADGIFLNPAMEPPRQELALALARHLTSAESATVLARTAGRPPAHMGADLTDYPLLAGFRKQAAGALPQPHNAELNEVWGYAVEMVAQVLDGKASPESAVLEAATLINDANGK